MSCSAPVLRIGTLILAVCATWMSPLASERQVLTFRTRAWLSFAPPTCRMALGQYQASPKLISEEGSASSFAIAYSLFDTSSAVCLRSPLSTVPAEIIVPALPQRSPPLLLTTAACGGLRSAPDCRPRRAFLHLSYSYAPPYSDGARDTRPHFGHSFGDIPKSSVDSNQSERSSRANCRDAAAYCGARGDRDRKCNRGNRSGC